MDVFSANSLTKYQKAGGQGFFKITFLSITETCLVMLSVAKQYLGRSKQTGVILI